MMRLRLIVSCLVGAMALTAQAVVQETWSENQTAARALTDDLEVTVEEGVTVTCSGAISGDYKLIKKGAGELILAADNTFTGGITVNAGTVLSGVNQTSAFGTGTVTVNSTGDKICRVGGCGGTIANDIAFAGATSALFPGLYIDGKERVKTTFPGAITAASDLHLETSCDGGELYGDYERAEFTGSIAVTSPGILAGAPHYIINFNCPVTADVIKGYWAASELSQDGGNHGAFKLSSTSIVANRAEIDQTRFICGVANVFSSTSVKSLYFTCEHKKNGVGYVDVNGLAQNFRSAYYEQRTGDDKKYYYMSEYVAAGEEGAEIVNSSSTKATVTIGNGDGNNNYSHWYIRMNGYMDWVSSNKQSDYYNRQHDLKGGTTSHTTYFRVYAGTRIDGLTKMSYTSGNRIVNIDATTDPDVLPDLTTLEINKNTFIINNQQFIDKLSRRGNLALDLVRNGEWSTLQLPSADSVLRVKSLKVNGETKEPGLYDLATFHSKVTGSTGKILVIGARNSETSTSVAWKGTENADFAAGANWEGVATDDSITNYLAYYAATINSDTSATLNEAVYLHGLTLGGDLTGFSVTTGESATAGIYLSGPLAFAEKNGTAAREFNFEAPINFAATSGFKIPENDELIIPQGSIVRFAVTNSGPGKLTLNDARITSSLTLTAGTLALGGKITGSGTIRFAQGNLYMRDAEVETAFRHSDRVNLRLAEGAGVTNVFSGGFTVSATATMYVPNEAVVVFEKFSSNGKYGFYGYSDQTGGTIILRNFTSGTRTDGYLHCNNSNRLIIDSSGATVASLWVNKPWGNLEFVRDDFFTVTSINGSKDRGILRFEDGTVNLHRTHQYGSRLYGAASVTGESPAIVEIVRGSVDGDVPSSITEAVASYSGVIKGGVSVVMNGAGVQTLTGKSTSIGELMSKKGTLELAANASWKNGTNFTARGTGKLKFAAAGQINSDFAVLHVDGDGKVEIADKVTNVVYRAETNGVWLKAGNYTCTGDDGAEGATGIPQLTGKGVLSVRGDDKVTTYDASATGEPNVKTVIVSNSWVEANVPEGKSVTNVPTGGNGYPYWKSYVLGLTPTNPVSKPIIKGVQNADPNNLAFKLGNVTYNAASGVKATYKVKASDTVNGSSWTDVSDPVSADKDATVPLPTDSPVKYYKVFINYSN